MAWPFSRRTTYNPSGPPSIKSLDLNAMQDEIARLWRMRCGVDYVFADDFNGAAMSDSWTLSGAITTLDDSATDGSGVMNLSVATATKSAIGTYKEPVNAKDFRISFRVRFPSLGAGSTIRIGMANGTSTTHKFIGFEFTSTQLFAMVGIHDSDSGSLGVPLATHVQFDIFALSGILYFYMAGALVWTFNTAGLFTPITTLNPFVYGTDAGTLGIALTDYFKFWFAR